jgi:endonuclease G
MSTRRKASRGAAKSRRGAARPRHSTVKPRRGAAKSKRGVGTTKPISRKFMEGLKLFVRTEGVVFLNDKNISSVGIGYKWKDGKPTNQLCIQFTVAEKASSAEAIEALGSNEIPKFIKVGKVEVPTDVIQRTYERAYKVVAERTGSDRKTRIDPVVPGVSVANEKETAGTLGCIVFDRDDGSKYILSNWHVLHGPQGNIGDRVVQPGPYDDNRVTLNHLGRLVRSHLGLPGDCAVATVEDRSVEEEILDLDTKPEQLGEPELGDKVVKSGRTTGVTHGVVTRVHTIAKIDYGSPVGEQSVGGFEISPDPAKLPSNGEISQGGDSGSIWLFKGSNGKTTNVMAGLHFAGEGPSDPNEHALACYPRSVFDKLGISLVPPQGQAEATGRRGYSSDFLGNSRRVALPGPSTSMRNDACSLNGSNVIHYTHFSLMLSKTRRFAFWVAWNIDGGKLKKISRTGLEFVFDGRIPKKYQAGDDLYADNRLDRGHIARRADLVWGTDAEARQANKDSFFFTNITPQMDNFNQSQQGGIWGKLEDAVFDEVDVEDLRVSVFGGPVFRGDDRLFRGVRIPREFFKVLAFVEAGELKARAFLLTQNLDQLELLELNEFKIYQVSLGEVEKRCGFTFPSNLKTADGYAELLKLRAEAISVRRPLGTLADIEW